MKNPDGEFVCRDYISGHVPQGFLSRMHWVACSCPSRLWIIRSICHVSVRHTLSYGIRSWGSLPTFNMHWNQESDRGQLSANFKTDINELVHGLQVICMLWYRSPAICLAHTSGPAVSWLTAHKKLVLNRRLVTYFIHIVPQPFRCHWGV